MRLSVTTTYAETSQARRRRDCLKFQQKFIGCSAEVRGKESLAGFTLIEVLVYIALFCIVIGMAATSVYELSDNSARGRNEALLILEGNFLLSKISYVIATTGSTDDIFLSGKHMMTKEDGAPKILNNSITSVHDLAFTVSGNNPEIISASFTLSSLTDTGTPISENFSHIYETY